MGRFRPVVALVLAVLVLATSSCAYFTPPDWAWFDVDHHPIGAYPAQAGFYFGEVVVYPVVFVFFVFLGTISNRPELVLTPEPRGLWGTGVLVGVLLGAPFHLLGLPFGDMGEDEPAPPEDDQGWPEADDSWEREYGH